jgi:hypothetical protein
MFPQPKKYGRYVVLAVFVLFAYRNPEGAAALVQHGAALLGGGADALTKFADAFQ